MTVAEHLNLQLAPWMEDALCQQFDGETWFPPPGGSAEPARRICRQCPVRAECLADALAAPTNPYGVWGGTTHHERAPMRHTTNPTEGATRP